MAQIEVRDLTQTTSVLDADSIHIVSGEGNGTSYYINRSDLIESAPLDNIEITGGSIDGTPIGDIGPSTGSFTSLDCDTFSCDAISVDLAAVTASADELNILYGVVASADDINIVSGKSTLAGLAAALGEYFYPVGSIYSNHSNGSNPATILGFGSWVAIEEVMLAGYKSGSTYFGAVGATGGSANSVTVSHTHSASSSTSVSISDPGHRHSYNSKETYNKGPWGADEGYRFPNASHTTGSSTTGISATASTLTSVVTAGESGLGKNLPPYLTVYMWRRIA